MKIKFFPTGQEVEGNSDKSLLQICQDNKIEIKSICKGVPSCAECRVKIIAGEGAVLPPTRAELGLIGNSYYLDQRRLSCQVRCFGDITVDISEQLARIDTTHKKIRGYKSNKEAPSVAVKDTLMMKK